jgi:hypothetical protein
MRPGEMLDDVGESQSEAPVLVNNSLKLENIVAVSELTAEIS